MSSRLRRQAQNPLRAGLVTALVLALIVVASFRKDNPFTHPFRLNVVVQNAVGVKPGSVVRIAGVDVGKVAKISRYNGAEAAQLTLELDETALPVHTDARVRIRPRLFLEGNFVVELSPGRPGAPTFKAGDTIPITRTSRAEQLDEVFSSFQEQERKDLQVVFQQLGKALNEQDPSDPGATDLTRGETGGESLNDTIKAAAEAGSDIRVLARALQGEQRGDLAEALVAFADTTEPLADRADDFGRLIDALDRSVSVFADNSAAVSATIAQLPQTVRTARRVVPTIRAALPPVRTVARNVADALPNTPELVRSSGPFLTQAEAFLSPAEGGAFAARLEPVASGLASSGPSLTGVIQDLDRLAVCTADVLAPTANQVISDGAYSTGLTSWDEFLRGFVGFNSLTQNFDANGGYARTATATGNYWVAGAAREDGASTPSTNLGTSGPTPLSTRPARPSDTKMTSTSAPWRYDAPCTAAQRPNLNDAPQGPADGEGR